MAFPSPFHPIENLNFVTLVEFRMRTMASQILEKSNWWEKVHNPEIVAKWRKEFVEQDEALVKKFWDDTQDALHNGGDRGPLKKSWPRYKITGAQLDYIFDELKWHSRCRDKATGIDITGIPKVYQSMHLIPSDVKARLTQGASILESVPEGEKDWHPGTNNQVLDLVHPSLHCLRIGKSLVKKEDGSLYTPTTAEYLESRPDFLAQYDPLCPPPSVSEQHQWLPTDFAVSASGKVTPLSYINNLHPDVHRSLYETISTVLEHFIPLFSRVISDVLSPERPLAVQASTGTWYAHCEDQAPSWDEYEGENQAEEFGAADEEYEKNIKWPLIPDPAPFAPPSNEGRVEFDFRGRTIQVIVKMANIMLTPENPTYNGGSWHVEGMENESIVATGLYYYSCSNISESKLGFRAAVGDGADSVRIPYEQDDLKGYLVVYGIDGNGGPLNQELGSIVTKEDKCLSFPNIYQHRVSPFELADPTKPGHRKILCFFLVNPTISILSTSRVPMQQQAWYLDEVAKVPLLQNLPRELYDMIMERLMDDGSIITMEKAKEERAKLMEERANYVVTNNEEVFETAFNMCEH